MQEALQKLGFYSGEEDMESSSFSSGTERAVKTWQEDTNGAAVTSATEISEVQQTLVKDGVTEVEVSEHRVFLLGKNRWEDSSRLSRNQKKEECDGTGEPNIEEQVRAVLGLAWKNGPFYINDTLGNEIEVREGKVED
ncbi:plastid transcriptionally active 5 [Prunus dulcis]|uniref:Plastid transcriptionally active 5 n=1 Tax=Prunus dulcis TaxID=3755 RepID=A0A4Y1S080_PRUDU|nr:plastid transcriptionally active 5 [Prunus dulcis]